MPKQYDTRLLSVGGRLANYRQRFGPDDPRVKAAEVEIRAIRAENAVADLLAANPPTEVVTSIRRLLGGGR